MGRRKLPYPPEFREEAVRLVRDGGKSIGRVAKDLGIADQSLRDWVKQTEVDAGRRTVQRQFTTPAPNRLWVADITYVRTGAGWLYLAVVLDVFSRRAVGWAMSCSCGTVSWTAAPRAGRSSTTSRGGTTRTDGTQHWSTAHQRTSRE